MLYVTPDGHSMTRPVRETHSGASSVSSGGLASSPDAVSLDAHRAEIHPTKAGLRMSTILFDQLLPYLGPEQAAYWAEVLMVSPL